MPPKANRTPTIAPATGDELGSPAQRERRQRILETTLSLAAKGGYESLQMRAVAEKAGVALGTLYRYFPSKVHLLVAALAMQFQRASERLERTTIPGDTPAERLLFVMARNTSAMQREPHLTEAMVRAFMFADTSAAAEVQRVGHLMEEMFTHAICKDEPTERDRAIFHLIADVWMANLIAWVTRRASASDVQERIELTVRLLLDRDDG
jgi:TetR/AcrR family transcriptional regulator, cholesterol catabolism regulator